jgi:hypothetical protein
VTERQTVRFANGPLHGAVIEIPGGVDPTALRITITEGGTVYDRTERRPLRGARLVCGPQPRKIVTEKAAPKRRRRSVPREG